MSELLNGFGIGLLIALLFGWVGEAVGQERPPEVASMPPRAIDGDTVRIGSETFRLVGFDTPEIFTVERCATREATRDALWLGYAAQGRLQRMLNSREVVIERMNPPKDRYGRTLAKFFVQGKDVGEVLIAEGLARPYVCPNNRCPPRKSWCQKPKE